MELSKAEIEEILGWYQYVVVVDRGHSPLGAQLQQKLLKHKEKGFFHEEGCVAQRRNACAEIGCYVPTQEES